MKALVDCDIDRLGTLLHADLRYVHATGVLHSRSGYLQFIREGLKFLDVQLGSRELRVHGDLAVVTGLLKQRIVRTAETEPVWVSSWAIEVWLLTDSWRLIDFQSTRLPPQ